MSKNLVPYHSDRIFSGSTSKTRDRWDEIFGKREAKPEEKKPEDICPVCESPSAQPGKTEDGYSHLCVECRESVIRFRK